MVAMSLEVCLRVRYKVWGPWSGFNIPHPDNFVSKMIKDNYESVAQIKEDLRKNGLESSNLIIGIDFTASNGSQGRNSFNGRNLHQIFEGQENPYQSVIRIIGRTLEDLDEDKIIPTFGFGDIQTKNQSVLPILTDRGSFCIGFEEVIQRYNKLALVIQPSGPTNFAPIIDKAVDIICTGEKKQYHILIIITDGQVSNSDREATIHSIVEASKFPLSIIIIGVGDGPFDEMEVYDDDITTRKFDNLQFVNYNKVISQAKHGNFDDEFALAAMMELPEQFKQIQTLKLMK